MDSCRARSQIRSDEAERRSAERVRSASVLRLVEPPPPHELSLSTHGKSKAITVSEGRRRPLERCASVQLRLTCMSLSRILHGPSCRTRAWLVMKGPRQHTLQRRMLGTAAAAALQQSATR